MTDETEREYPDVEPEPTEDEADAVELERHEPPPDRELPRNENVGET